MNNNESSSSMGVIVGILVVVVIVIVGYIAYSQGFFTGKAQTPNTNGVQVQVGGTTSNPPSNSGY